jgi:hypothetical protein
MSHSLFLAATLSSGLASDLRQFYQAKNRKFKEITQSIHQQILFHKHHFAV